MTENDLANEMAHDESSISFGIWLDRAVRFSTVAFLILCVLIARGCFL